MPRIVLAFEVPGYLLSLVAEVEEKTGYPVALTEEPSLSYDAITRFATPDHPYHEVNFVPEYRDHALHFFTVGLRKISRFWDVPPEDRYVPVTPAERALPKTEHDELLGKFPAGSGLDPDVLSRFLYSGMVRQLISVPGDLRVEREIAEKLPEHQSDQQAYLRRQVKDLEPHFDPAIQEFAPARLYEASTAMNVVLVAEIADIANVPVPDLFRSTRHDDTARELRELLRDVDDPGYHGDRMVTDAWTLKLEMEQWFEWMLLSDL